MRPESTALESGSLRRDKACTDAQVLGLNVSVIALPSARCAFVDEGSGPAVLLLHGAPMTSLAFLRVIRALRDDYRVMAPDFPGWGGSTEAKQFGRTLDDYAQFVCEFVEALELDDYYVFVNDSSACIGLSALSQRPKGVSGIIVADTVPIPLKGRSWWVKLVLKHVVNSSFMRFLNRQVNLLAWMVATVAPMLNRFPKHERRVLVSQFDTKDKRDRILDTFGKMASDEAFMERTAEGIRKALSKIPALVIYGQFDPMRYAGGDEHYQQQFSQSTLAIVPWEEHFPILASGGRVGEIIGTWISELRNDGSRC